MRQCVPRPAAALAAAVALVTGGVAGVTGGMAGAATRPAAQAPAVHGGGQFRTIVLLNGTRLVFGPAAGGARIPAIVPAARGQRGGALLARDLGGRAYDIPQAALPYLGRGLDPDLFMVSSLLREESAGRLPVTVTYTGRTPALPGVTITHAGGGTAQGYLTPAGAAVFGAALARQFAADHARGSYGQDGLFAGGVSIRLAAVPATARPVPAFPMHTLTVTGTNLAGGPDTGDYVLVFNADNSRRFGDPIEMVNIFDKGVTKFSLPAGHYWALGEFPLLKKPYTLHLVVLPQFTVAQNAAVHVAERAADSEIMAVTPRPAVPSNLQMELRHTASSGPPAALWYLDGFGGVSPIFLNRTTSRPTAGTLQEYTFEQLFSPAKAPGTPYEYDLAFASRGVIGSQRHVVRPSGLATVHGRYYSDVDTTGYESRFGVFGAQWKTVPGVLFLPRKVPRQQTEYMTGNPAVLWADTYEQSYQNLAGGQVDDLRTFHAGGQLTENWNAYPLHAGYNTNLIGAANPALTLPSASRKGDALTLDVMPFSDSMLGHESASGFFGGFQAPFGKIAGHYEIDENGKVIAQGNPLKHNQEIGPAGEFHTTVALSPHPATIRLVLDASRTAKIYPISTASRTVWTWRSHHESGARLPAGWGCRLTIRGTAAGDRSCAVEPLLTLQYAVAGESLHGSTHAGPQTIHLSAGHLQLVNGARVTRAALSVSVNGGKTWHRVTLTGHGGSYTATFTAPAGVQVSLRASAADAPGGTITETLPGAYQVAP